MCLQATVTLKCANWTAPLLATVGASVMNGPSMAVVLFLPNGTAISPIRRTLNTTLVAVARPPYQPNAHGCSGTRVEVSFSFNGSSSVPVTIHGNSGYHISEDEVCAAVVPLVELDSCLLNDPTSTVVLALFHVIAPRTTLQSAVAATTTAISALSTVASGLGGGEGGTSTQVMAAIAMMPCAPPSIRATYGVYRALSVVALNNSLFGVLEGGLIVLGMAVMVSSCVLRVCARLHRTWITRLAAARFPNYAFAALMVLHLPMAYAAVVLVSGSAGEAPPLQRVVALVVGVVILVVLPVFVLLTSKLFVPHWFCAHVADASDWVQAPLLFIAPYGHLAPNDIAKALSSAIGQFRVPLGVVAVVPFVPSLLLSGASIVSPSTVGGCVALFAALLLAFTALIPLYLLLRPYRWPGLNVACAASTVPVLGLLALMIAELQGHVGAAVDSAIAVLLAVQLALTAATVALQIVQLLLSARMDPVKCCGPIVWTARPRPLRCMEHFLRGAEDPILAPLETDVRSDRPATAKVVGDLQLAPLRALLTMNRDLKKRHALEQRMALALLVETVCGGRLCELLMLGAREKSR
jgi:hypothetical protein